MDIEAQVKSIIREQIGDGDLAAESIALTDRLVDDLGFDSLDLIEIAMFIDDEFDIDIPSDRAEQIKTVDEVVELVTSLTARRN